MVAFKLNKLKHLGKTHRPLTFPLEEIGQQLQFFSYVLNGTIWLAVSFNPLTNCVQQHIRMRKFVFWKRAETNMLLAGSE